MKITKVEPILCDGGWCAWIFVKVQTDEGLTGYGECTDWGNPLGVAGAVRDIAPTLVDKDPRAVERLYADMSWHVKQSRGGIAQKAVAGIDVALWDVKAKALGIPVYELFGGPLRDRVRLYWSHCGTYRAQYPQLLGTKPLRTMDDIAALGREVVSRGFTALKTNMVVPGEPARILRNLGSADYTTVRAVDSLMRTLRQAVGDEVDIALDLNFNFKTEGFIRIARALEPYNLIWLELDTYDPGALLQVRQSTRIPICSAENLITLREYKPFFDLHALDIAMIDVAWNGFTESRRIAALADIYDIPVAPHNYYSHLSTMMSVQFCAAAPTVKIMEVDVDAVPWRDDIVTDLPEIRDGFIHIPTKPGIGTELNEKEIARHPWPK